MKEVFVPSITICKENYETSNDMWTDINNLCRMLLRAGYEVKLRVDESALGIYVIEYLYDSRSHAAWGSDRFVAVTADEHVNVLCNRNIDESTETNYDDDLPF